MISSQNSASIKKPQYCATALLIFGAIAGCESPVVFQPVVLGALQVAGTQTALNPVFDPNTLRYSVIADASASTIDITAMAHESLVISLDNTIASSNATVSISGMQPGDIIEIKVEGQGPRQAFPACTRSYICLRTFPN